MLFAHTNTGIVNSPIFSVFSYVCRYILVSAVPGATTFGQKQNRVKLLMTIMTEYVDDELPLPPFAELFGEGLLPNKKKLKKFRENPQADETTG